jgi:DNA-binding NarL/FixJ family response regulator
MTIRILIADDQALVRAGLRTILTKAGGFDVVGEAADGTEAIAAAIACRPDVVLMDVRMPGRDGIAATREIRSLPQPPRILVLTTFDLDEYVYAGLRAGASGFLLKDAMPHELASAIRVVAAGEAIIAPTATRRLVERFLDATPPVDPAQQRALATLTDREHEVLILVAHGRSNSEIAGRLHLAEGTVRTHVGRIFSKLGVRDRVQAVVLAYQAGVVRPGA